jgi:glycosyltransferase involved in cell wall biosynthesis
MGAETSALVTVVTPVYNGAHYLAECIESVLGQTYGAFDYVIVDNASTDGSLELARGYETRDGRIRVFACDEHYPNHHAHWNRAMRLIPTTTGYVKILHADDWLFEECLERMVDLAERHPRVGVVGAYRLDEDRVNLDGLPPTTTVVPGRELARSFLLGRPLPFLFGAPTSLLLRADLVRQRDPFYNEDNWHADNEACLAILARSDFGFVHQVLTYTRRHNEAITSRTKRLGTFVASDVDVFQRLGPQYLSEDEYERKLVVRLLGYAGFLATRPDRWTDREFRSFHRNQLGTFLSRTSVRELARGVALQARRTGGRILSHDRETTNGESSAGGPRAS